MHHARMMCLMHDTDAGWNPNPFTPDFGRRPAVLAGREAMLRDVAAALNAGPSERRYTRLFLGQRGSGKTTLLAEIRDVANASGMLTMDVNASTPGLPDRISERLDQVRRSTVDTPARDRTRRYLSGLKLGPVGLSWSEVTLPPASMGLGSRLEAISAWAGARGTGVLLAVDEMHAGDRDELRYLASEIQRITKVGELPLALVGAGLPEMTYTVLEDKKMTFFHRCHRDPVHEVDFDDAWSCVRRTIEGAGGRVDPDALEGMAEASAGNVPYLLQSIGYHAWRLSAAPSRAIDLLSAQTAITRARRDMREHVTVPAWHDLANADHSYLQALAVLGGEATRRDIAGAVRGVSGRSLGQTERRLVASGHVVRTPDGTVRLRGILSRGAIDELVEAEMAYESARPREAPRTRAARRCNTLMPRARAKCVLPRGHKGGHRSRI